MVLKTKVLHHAPPSGTDSENFNLTTTHPRSFSPGRYLSPRQTVRAERNSLKDIPEINSFVCINKQKNLFQFLFRARFFCPTLESVSRSCTSAVLSFHLYFVQPGGSRSRSRHQGCHAVPTRIHVTKSQSARNEAISTLSNCGTERCATHR